MVLVEGGSRSEWQQRIDEAYAVQRQANSAQYSDVRTLFLLAPTAPAGLDLKVGYFQQYLGVGAALYAAGSVEAIDVAGQSLGGVHNVDELWDACKHADASHAETPAGAAADDTAWRQSMLRRAAAAGREPSVIGKEEVASCVDTMFRGDGAPHSRTVAACSCFLAKYHAAAQPHATTNCHPAPVAGAGVGTHAFWRSVEGVETLTTRTERAEAGAKVAASDRSSQPDAVWMVSQACPIRRARFATLWLAAPAGVSSQWLSGGFTSEVEVSGEMVFASQYGQEQWLSRNVQAGQLTASERSHNIVFANSAAKVRARISPRASPLPSHPPLRKHCPLP